MKNAPRFTRRQFITALAVSPLLLNNRAFAIPTNPDVVIIGAGAAGLAAASTLLANNISCVILEGSDRVGGRAFTDTQIFGVPYDLGCHWVYEAQHNPWMTYAEENGFHLYKEPHAYESASGVNIFTGDRNKIEPVDDFEDAVEELSNGINRAAEKALDISAAEANKNFESPWKPLAENWWGAWDMGKDFNDFSTQDWYNSPWTESYFCKEGYGSIVAHFGKNLPVQLNSKVTEIDWSGTLVKVKSIQGTLSCKAVIITVSTGVLAADHIKFTPNLPTNKQESFHKISMGSYNHLGLQFKRNIFGDLGADEYLLYQTESEKSTGYLINSSGSNLTYAMIGGKFGWELEKAGFEAGINFTLDELVKIYGSDIRKDFIKGYFPRWGHNTWTLGSYASAEPGAYHYRRILRETIGEKLFFAGEATHRMLWATCGGARLTGEESAKQIIKTLKKTA